MITHEEISELKLKIVSAHDDRQLLLGIMDRMLETNEEQARLLREAVDQVERLRRRLEWYRQAMALR